MLCELKVEIQKVICLFSNGESQAKAIIFHLKACDKES